VWRDWCVGRRRRGRLDWIYALVLELLLQNVNVRAQARVLALEALGMAARPSETGDAVCGAALGVVLCARRAASRLRVTSYLADLLRRMLVDMYRLVLQPHVIGFQDGCVSSSLSHPPGPTLSFFLHASQSLPRSYLASVAGLASAVGGALPAGGGGERGVIVIFDVQVLSRVFRRHGRAGIVVDRALHRHGRPLVEMRRAWAADDDDVTQARLGRVSDELMATSVSAARAAQGGRAQESGVSVGGWHGWWVRRGGGGFEAVRARAMQEALVPNPV
jgi:hypothetical protein